MYEMDKHGTVNVICGDVPLNVDVIDRMTDLLEESLGGGQPRVVVDLAKVLLMDSAGIELLLDYRDKCQQCGGDLKLAAPNRLCEDILFATGIDQEIEVVSETLRAVGSFAR